MLLAISIILIFLLTSTIIYYTYISRKCITSMTGMAVSMTNSMMSSISIGTILGIIIPNKDLTLPTIISVLIGMVVGYLTGRPISLLASLEGLTAGIMGGMMGAMLGVMLQPNSAEIMVYFIDFVSVLINILQIRIIDEEAKTNQQEFYKKPMVVNLIVFIVLLIFIFSLFISSINLIHKH